MANALLRRFGFLWKFPEQKKKRATTPTGNDARRFHTNPGLREIFYPDEESTVYCVLPRMPELRAATAAQAFGEDDDG